jgi:hypothetical protein
MKQGYAGLRTFQTRDFARDTVGISGWAAAPLSIVLNGLMNELIR